MLEELNATHGTQYKMERYHRSMKGTPVDLKNHFPLGKSPILTIEENGQPSKQVFQLPQYPGVLTESRLIMKWLAETYSKGMWSPESEMYRRQDEFIQEFANDTLSVKIICALVYEVIPQMLPWGFRHALGALVSPIVGWWVAEQQPMFKLMEGILTEESPWFSGPMMGLADFNMMWPMDMAYRRHYFKPEECPKVNDWYQRIVNMPAYKRAIEKGGVYNLETFLGSEK